MRKENILTAKVSFITGSIFLGSVALFSIMTILEASDNVNPIEEAFLKRTQLDERK